MTLNLFAYVLTANFACNFTREGSECAKRPCSRLCYTYMQLQMPVGMRIKCLSVTDLRCFHSGLILVPLDHKFYTVWETWAIFRGDASA